MRMRRPGPSIAHLCVVVFVLAVAMAAVRSGSSAWSGAITSITFFAMLSSFLGVAFGRGARRVYWFGFATLGWGYLVLVFLPWTQENVGQFLLASNLYPVLERLLHLNAEGGLQSVPTTAFAVATTGGGFGGVGGMGGRSSLDAVRILSGLEALLWAYLGGWVARYFASGEKPGTTTANGVPATSPEAAGA